MHRIFSACKLQVLTPTQEMLSLAKQYNKWVEEEAGLSKEKRDLAEVGKVNPKKRLQSDVQKLMSDNIDQCLGTMMDTVVF